MRQVTLEIIKHNDCTRYKAVRRVYTFKKGDLIKFITPGGIKTTVFSTGDRDVCKDCVFYKTINKIKCPRFTADVMSSGRLLCNHHRYGSPVGYFKPLDSVLEDL